MKSVHATEGLVICAAVVAVFTPKTGDISETDTFSAPGLDPLTISDDQTEFWRVTPALLLVVYEAFGETQEDAIYDHWPVSRTVRRSNIFIWNASGP